MTITQAVSERAAETPAVQAKPRRRLAWAVAAVFALMAAVSIGALAYQYFSLSHFSLSPKDERAIRFAISLPENTTLSTGTDAPFPAISPDGRNLAFVTLSQGRRVLWLQGLDSLKAQLVPGSEDAHHPFWSPDSLFIGFFAGGKLKKASIAGGAPITLTDAGGPGLSPITGTWNRDGVIIFGEGGLTGTTALYRVSADSGVPAKLIEVNAVAGEERLTFPYFLPDGRRFLYLARSAQPERSAVYLASLDAGEKKRILTVNSRVVYSAPGHLLFARSGTLMAQPFDLRRGETTGDAFPVDQVAGSATLGTGAFSVSDEGALAFAEGGGGLTTRLTWFDRTGQQLSVIDGAGFSTYPWLSPDGQRLAVARSSVDANIWLIDLLRPTHSPLTLQGGNIPVWSPDGKTVVFVATRNNKQGLYQKAADGAGNEELLVENAQAAMDWSSDGRFILFRRDNNGRDVWALDMGAERKASPVLEMKFNEDAARISPDGRWITYSSDESGRPQIYVQQFPPSEGKWAVSKEGAIFPRWRTDGRELLYQTLDNEIVAVEVKLESMFEPGARHVLFKIPGEVVNGRWAATPDAQRFLFPLPGAGGPPITVLTNWIATVKK